MKTLGHILLAALLAPALLAAAAALLGQLGRSSLAWDVLNHFAPAWLAGSLVGVVGGLRLRGLSRGLVCAFCLAGVAASASTILPEYLRGVGPAASPQTAQLKVAQFNGWFANRRPERVMAFLRAEDPDVAVLQEVSTPVRQALARQSTWHVNCARCEVVILSKSRAVSMSHTGTATLVRLRDGRGVFTVIGAHNAWPTDADQAPQEARLARLIARTPRERTILAGDFNSTPWSFARRRWDRAFGLIRRDRGLASWPTKELRRPRVSLPMPVLPIDHIYAGEAWATVAVRRGPQDLGSDHFPIVATLAAAE